MEILLLIWLAFAIIASLIGSTKHQGGLGFILGFLFGPFGILIILLTKGSRRKCPYCKELVQLDATVCPHCQREIKYSFDDKRKATHYDRGASDKLLKSDLRKFKKNKP